jgi:S1-C subfamily serine protease
VTFGTPRIDGGALFYSGGGAISQSVGIHHGYPTCRTMDALYPKTTAGASFRARRDNWFVALFRHGETSSYLKVTCHSTGTISTEMTVPVDTLEKHRGLFAAMAGSLVLMRTPDPTVRPRPRVDELPLAPTSFSDQQTARPQAKAKPARPAKPSTIDDSGKTVALKLETRDGPDLRAEDVFDKASGAVYVVKADRRLGSAVAISDNELLTNCHVTGNLAEVKIARAKDEMPAKVISRNADADRCVLRTDTKLAKWVTVRPYDDIRVGERAITIGTPQGLELSAAEGIVSSKRLYNQTRVVQTSAPISQGSSGGGLFDARGHLLGITTFYFRGGQNLNFAVAAEEYAQEREESATR